MMCSLTREDGVAPYALQLKVQLQLLQLPLKQHCNTATLLPGIKGPDVVVGLGVGVGGGTRRNRFRNQNNKKASWAKSSLPTQVKRRRGGSGGMGCLHSNRNGYHYLYLLPISAQRLTVLAPSFGSHQTGHKSMPEWEMVARAGR